MEGISLITICHKRTDHLQRVLRGIEKGKKRPDEIIIVFMGSHNIAFDNGTLNVRQIELEHRPEDPLPLAKARNLGAKTARFNRLVFLDVDCIPSPLFVLRMDKYLSEKRGLIMGTPKYLNEKVDEKFDFEDLNSIAIDHPDRPVTEGVRRWASYEMFWSLCFGISDTDYDRVGRFDEKFIGYGGEDTDFALMARHKKVPFYICDATVFHQPHTLHHPPLQHFLAIVINANYFFRKWKKWPMGNYLNQFAELNLINWHPGSNLVTILRFPNEREVVSTKITNAPFL